MNYKSKILVLLFFSTFFFSFSQTGRVIKVKDGDTVVILDDNKVQYTIRVADIDCPEKNQPFGKEAKEIKIYIKKPLLKRLLSGIKSAEFEGGEPSMNSFILIKKTTVTNR